MNPPRTAHRGTTPLADTTRWIWTDDAACAGEDIDVFFADDPTEAKQVCVTCPVAVRRTCRDYAITKPERHGVWGGLDEEQRTSEVRRRQRGHAPRYAFEDTFTPEPKRRPASVASDDPWTTPHGSTRRLRALFADGHAADVVADVTGLAKPTLVKLRHGHSSRTRTSTARKITVAYGRLVGSVPGDGAEKRRRLGVERGWDTSDAWSGVDMDDPDAVPHQTANAA